MVETILHGEIEGDKGGFGLGQKLTINDEVVDGYLAVVLVKNDGCSG